MQMTAAITCANNCNAPQNWVHLMSVMVMTGNYQGT
jgi:hypothetical protein